MPFRRGSTASARAMAASTTSGTETRPARSASTQADGVEATERVVVDACTRVMT